MDPRLAHRASQAAIADWHREAERRRARRVLPRLGRTTAAVRRHAAGGARAPRAAFGRR